MLSSSFMEMRKRNALSIVQTVRQQPGLSRADVARACDLAKSTVSSIVDELVQRAVLEETGSKTSSRGRRPVGLVFNTGARVSVGISLDDDRLEVAMCDLDGNILAVRSKRYSRKIVLESVFSLLLSELDSLMTEQNMNSKDVVGLGLAIPGPVSAAAKSMLNGMNLDLENLRVRLLQKLRCEAVIDSNTNMSAIAESRLGAAKYSKDAFIVRLGREVRSALIQDSKLSRGNQGLAGELGHICIPGFEGECRCRRRGCINTLAGIDEIVSRCQSNGAAVEQIDDVISAAIDGDINCQKALADAGSAIAYGVASAINIIAPTDVIVTGKLVAAGPLLIDSLKSGLSRYAFPANLRNCNVSFNNSQQHSEALGASLAPLLQEEFLMRLVTDETEIDAALLPRA